MSDPSLRLILTIGLLVMFLALEVVVPARKSALTLSRILNQAGLALISAVLARLALAGGLANIALYAQGEGWGFFNVVEAPSWLAVGASFLLLDFAIWVQHMALHRVAFLWRLHRVHHGDTVMDVTTALRFHPFEILASLGFKVALVVAVGAPPEAVLAFEMILGAGALFTHANIALPTWLERPLRWVIITPALHLIHHSPKPIETNSNYGFSFSFWDRIFGTYRGTGLIPNGPVGLEKWRAAGDQKFAAMLINPMRS